MLGLTAFRGLLKGETPFSSHHVELIIMSKPPAVPGDSQSLTFPGV